MSAPGGGGSDETELQEILQNLFVIHSEQPKKKSRLKDGHLNIEDQYYDDEGSVSYNQDGNTKRKASSGFYMYIKLGRKGRSRKFTYTNIEDAKSDRRNLSYLTSEEGRQYYGRKAVESFYSRRESCFTNSKEFLARRNNYLKRLIDEKKKKGAFAALNVEFMDDLLRDDSIRGSDLVALENHYNMAGPQAPTM